MTDPLAANLQRVRDAIHQACARVDRDPERIQVIAVTKTVPVDRIRAAAELGLRCFGENRVQEALPKMDVLADLPCRWHLIGHLQTNKARFAPRFTMVQSVDSIRLVDSLERHLDAPLDVLMEVNVAREDQKTGARPEDVDALADALRHATWVHWRGLMTIAPLSNDPEQARPVFRQLRELARRLEQAYETVLPDLSMGMTDDYAVAVEEGATMLRLGRALFGARPS